MPRIHIHRAVYQTLAVIAVVTASLAVLFSSAVEARAAGKERVLHTFSYSRKGGEPQGRLILDSAGNLYGAARSGGGHNVDCVEDSCGVVFELTRNVEGKWKETLLYVFKGDRDGSGPNSVIRDSAGNVYGTALIGGNGPCVGGCGLVFELMPSKNGLWSKSVLHDFLSADGANPAGGLLFDSAGNLYGTTESGGLGFGVVFKLIPTRDGKWEEKVLHAFTGKRDGASPSCTLILDAAGNIHGTAPWGGDLSCDAPNGCGVVFELLRSSGGKWKQKVLHVFTGRNSSSPNGGLVFDANGNLYGSTYGGGTSNSGIVFELTPQSDGKWKETVLRAFSGGRDGNGPNGDLLFDTAGNLYGTTYAGGAANRGVVFELETTANGNWNEVVLHDFTGARDGIGPEFGLTVDGAGTMFGTTLYGGINDAGVAFEIPAQ
jgi:uncharacterized repeat protein (TIGR03803 family)